MNQDQLIQLAIKAREAQRQYYRTKSGGDLEKKLDKAHRDYLNGPTLFDSPSHDR